MANETKTKKATSKKEAPKKEVKREVKSVARKAPAKKVEPKIIQEENHYGRTLLAAILIVVIFVGGYLAVQYSRDGEKNNYKPTESEKKFKEEYESLNGTVRKSGQKNREVSIIDDNNIVYITLKDAEEKLNDGSGVIYFGYAACPYSRNAIAPLLKAMSSSELDTIYYVNIRPGDDETKDIRDEYKLNEKGKPKQQKGAEPEYYNVLMALAGELHDYVLINDKGKEVNIGEKRLDTPTVVAVKNGELVGFHEGTVESHKEENGNVPDLTKDQEKELVNIYSELISKYLNN